MRNLFQKLETRIGSKEEAKHRLQVVLSPDHEAVALPVAQLDQMRDDVLAVVARYLEVDPEGIAFQLRRDDGKVFVEAFIPVRRAVQRPSES